MQKQHARWRNTTNKRTWKRPRLINDYNEEDMILEKGNTKRIIYLCNKIEATKLYNHIEDISYHLAKIIVGTSVFWCYVSVLYRQFYCNTLNSLHSHSIRNMGTVHCNIFLYFEIIYMSIYICIYKPLSNFNIECYIRTYHLEFEVQQRGKTTFTPWEAQ